MLDAINEINSIVQSIDNVRTTQKLNSTQNVRVLLAHWNYDGERVERYGGFRWVFNHWRELKENPTDEIDEICSEKICILSFESREQIAQCGDSGNPKRKNMLEKIKLLLRLETVAYVQTPPKQLEDIEQAVKKLSKISFLSNPSDIKKVEQSLHEMDFYQVLNSYLHELSHKHDNSSLETFKNIRTDLPSNLKSELSGLLDDFQFTLENFQVNNTLESLITSDAYINLNEKVQKGWF